MTKSFNADGEGELFDFSYFQSVVHNNSFFEVAEESKEDISTVGWHLTVLEISIQGMDWITKQGN